MKVLICGDRYWKDSVRVLDELAAIHSITPVSVVIEGGTNGADTAGHKAAVSLGIPVVHMPANWRLYGRAAGPIRNQAMLDQHPDLVLAFHHNLAVSKGTKDMVNRAWKAGIKVRIIGQSR